MNFDRIYLSGFKNIENVDIKLDKIVSLLAINSYGKSNFLDGIIFGINFIRKSTNEKSRMFDNDFYKPLNTKNTYGDFVFEIELTNARNKEFNKIIYGYSFKWSKKKEEGEIVKEYLKIKDNISQKYTSFIKRDGNKATYKSSITSACNKIIKINSNELLINKLIAYDDLYFLDVIQKINQLYIYVDRHFETNCSYDIEPIVRKNNPIYSLDNTNVPRALYYISKDYPDKFELIINTVKDIFPFIDDIKIFDYGIDDAISNKIDKEKLGDRFILANQVYVLVAYDKNTVQAIEFSNMSDGVRRVLLVFTTLVLADINNYSLVAVEEPENSLNPKILQRYLMALSAFAKKTKVIITSHSPYLINYMNPQNIYIGLPNDFGLAKFSKIKSVNKLLNDSENMGMLVGNYLFSLMSGDENDLEVLLKYVEIPDE